MCYVYEGQLGDDSCYGGVGLALGSHMPIIVELKGSLKQYVFKHLKESGLSEADSKCREENRHTWFGLIDGHNTHEAIIRLRDCKDKCIWFLWFVSLVHSGFLLQRY